jgi:nucleoside-diphosphate-sugar epimerase
MSRVLVTGEAGFTGSHLVDALLAAGRIDVPHSVDGPAGAATANVSGARQDGSEEEASL